MIVFPKYLERSKNPIVRIFGIGNAGVNLVDRLALTHNPARELIAVNSDQQSLASSIVPAKIALGITTTRGLGAGGDPEVGLEAAQESFAEIEQALAGSDIVILCAGLGGGTGSGALSLISEAAKQNSCLLFVVVTTPFIFEGRRRATQARNALQDVADFADAVIHFKNDRITELSAPRAGVAETFAACDALMTNCIESLVGLLATQGPVAIGLPDLMSVLSGGNPDCLFAYASGQGGNRAHDAVEALLRGPLLDRGKLLDQASKLLVHISGPPNLTFAEISVVMQEIATQACDHTLLHLGITTLADTHAPITVILIGRSGSHVPLEQSAVRQRPIKPKAADEPRLIEVEPAESDPIVEAPIVQRLPKPMPTPSNIPSKIRQETLQFEPVARGRFEKIEPTMVEGEDLDIPTFQRRNLKQ